MGVKINRDKERSLIASVLYRLKKIPLSKEKKLRFFLNLEWIFERLAHEASYEFYESDSHPMRRRSVDYILQFIEPEFSVLDIGCSRGEITHKVAEKAKLVVGVDHSADAIAEAKKYKNANLSFYQQDAREFLDGSETKFDVLILSHVLEHLDDPKSFLTQISADFRYVYVEVPDFEKTIFNNIRQELGLSLIYTDSDHVSEFDRNELTAMLSECGLEILNSEYIFGVQRYWCRTK
ncbi:hypothetical protein BH10ACI2_BH10ACI2_12950 [soil metagenome]